MRQVDTAQIEAALLDGANFFQLMRYVLLPAIRPTITLMMIMTVIWSFLAFDFVYVLTQGGPAYSSEVLSTLSYRYAFYNYTIGPAAAVALVISFFGLIATVFYVRHPAKRGRLMNQTARARHDLSPTPCWRSGRPSRCFRSP